MRLLYHLLAQDVLIDEDTNTASAIKVVERLVLRESRVPIEGETGIRWLSSPMTLLVVFHADEDDGDASFQVTIQTPDGSRIPPITFPANFDGKAVSRCKVRLPGVPDQGSGTYVAIIGHEDGEATWSFEVTMVSPTAPEGVLNEL